ncbi:MAG: HAD-IA family hydrolase [bacterium]|nr:HAD-IA family hydrolase [bacterium]
MNISSVRFLFLSLFCFLTTIHSGLHNEPAVLVKKHIIFDLNGVLLKTDTLKAVRELGLTTLIGYSLTTGKKPSDIKNVLFKTFNTIQPTGNDCDASDPCGLPLPGLLCDWLKGTKTSEELRKLVLPAIKKNKQWFTNNSEQQLIYRTARMMFNPKRLCNTVTLIKEGLRFVIECKKKGYAVYVLSNFDTETFDLIKEKYPQLFELFDGIIVSGNVHLIKPMPEIYELFTKKLPAQNCIFIDDQEENIYAAQGCGITAIHCHKKSPGLLGLGSNPDFDEVRKQFAKIEHVGPELSPTIDFA